MLLPSFVIPRHTVAQGQDGLSSLQRALVCHAARIRIASAPTGAGKSYAFLRAVDAGKRVLFIVPTRRLAQNLAGSILEGDPSAQVALWTSDAREKLKAESPDLNIGRLRIRQLRGLEARREGEIIIATPESVVWMLLRPSYPGLGEAQAGLNDPIREFDHIVFDEFHSIDARGFGLAAALCKVASGIPGENGARITFLSATPIEIKKPLEALGVNPENIASLAEEILTGAPEMTGAARALHGDVTVSFHNVEDLATLAENNQAQIAGCLARGRQVVLVFDALRDLLPAKERLAKFFDRLGVPKERRLSINSADDNSRGGEVTDFCAGRDADPMNFDVLIATSSVEMGVTFRAGLMLMDPGFDALSFVQRVGRVARGDEPGSVFVRATERQLSGMPWLHRLVSDLRETMADATQLPVDRFTNLAMKSMARRFDARGDRLEVDTPPDMFRSMPMRAVWCSALFWAAMERRTNHITGQSNVTLGLRRTLESFRPRQAAKILVLLRTLSESSLNSAKAWAKAFEAEALRARLIPVAVKIKEPDGRERPLSSKICETYQELLSAPSYLNERDELVLLVERRLEQILGDGDRKKRIETVEVIFPHEGGLHIVNASAPWVGWLDKACRDLKRTRRPEQREALEAAIELVSLSHIVPEKDADRSPADNLII